MSSLDDYWQALQRLINNEPVRVPRGSLINNDTVALEAGRRRGSIKKSRPSFSELISAISKARAAAPSVSTSDKLKTAKLAKDAYRDKYHAALNRELMLIERVAELEKEVDTLKKVVPIRR